MRRDTGPPHDACKRLGSAAVVRHGYKAFVVAVGGADVVVVGAAGVGVGVGVAEGAVGGGDGVVGDGCDSVSRWRARS